MSHAWSENRILSHLPAARQLYAAQKDAAIAYPAPRFISIWLSEICNLDCTYCFFAESNHDPERKFIDTKEILSWLREMRDFGAEALEFSGGGEPTVHKDFPEIFHAAADMGYALGLITHACNKMPLEMLAAHAKYVRCGLDAATKETHAKIKRKEGRFDDAVNNIKALVKLRDSGINKGFTVGIKVVVNSINAYEIPQIVSLARHLNVDYVQFKYEHSSDHPIDDLKLSTYQDYLESEAKVFLSYTKTKVLANLKHQRATTKCFMSPIHTVVNSRGEILQCCFMYERPIGSIREPIREVWGGPKHREVIAKTTVAECDKVDCRWNFYNKRMEEIINDPLQQISFI